MSQTIYLHAVCDLFHSSSVIFQQYLVDHYTKEFHKNKQKYLQDTSSFAVIILS